MTLTTRLLILWALCVSLSLVAGQEKSEAQRHADRGIQLMQARNLPSAESELRRAVELAPTDPACLADLGMVLGMEQKLRESNQYFQKALQFNPNDLSIRQNLAYSQWRLGQTEKAEDNLKRILKTDPHNGDATFLLGMIEENLQHFASAIHLLGSVPELVRKQPESIVALARSYYQTQNPPGARQTLRMLLEGPAPAPPEAVYRGGQAAMDAKDYSMAGDLFASIQSSYPDRVKAGYYLALSRYRAGMFRECQDTLLHIDYASAPTRDVYKLLGWCYAEQDKMKEALGAFGQAVHLDPSDESTYLDVANMLVRHGKYENALALGKEMVGKFPNSYRAYMVQGSAQANRGFLTDAVKSFERACELNPKSPEANYDLAVVQNLAGFTQDALRTLERGTKAFPRDALHFQEYATLLVPLAEGGDAGAEARAYSALNTAVHLDNSLAESQYLLGRLEMKDNEPAKAASELEIAARLDPQNAIIHLHLSRAYSRLGTPDKAAKEMEIYQNSVKNPLTGGRGRIGVGLRHW
ncbi:MAG: tetratricopeptide repeat protein [Terriglobia bacterium]